MIKGKIHSVESMGLVDGPGIRVVVFMQGCALRCLYCHNPDTWTLDGNKDALDFTPEEILKYTDLVLYDVKHLTREGYKDMTGIEIDETQKFLEVCKKMGTKMWIRQVVVPGKTDSEEYIRELGKFIKTLNNVEKVELLPYHLLGVSKYETLGIKYRLEGLEAMDKEACKELYKFLELEK